MAKGIRGRVLWHLRGQRVWGSFGIGGWWLLGGLGVPGW